MGRANGYTVVASHESALRAIRHERCLYGRITWKTITKSEQRRALESCPPAANALDNVTLARVGLTSGLTDDTAVDVLCSSPDARRAQRRLRCHCVSNVLPAESILLAAKPDVYVAAPALCVIHYASRHALAETIGLLYELCGTFSLPPDERPQHSAPHAEAYSYCESDAVLTPDVLTRYLSRCEGIRGLVTARRATRYALGGARSPAEAVMDALFHTSKRLGGFGFTPMLLNHRINFTADARDVSSGMPYAVADAYIPKAHAILEYNGSHHSMPEIRTHDEKRNNALKAMGLHVYVINNETLRDVEALEAIARSITRNAGLRYRCNTKGCRVKQVELLNGLRSWANLKPC